MDEMHYRRAVPNRHLCACGRDFADGHNERHRRTGHGRRSTDLPGTASGRARELAQLVGMSAPESDLAAVTNASTIGHAAYSLREQNAAALIDHATAAAADTAALRRRYGAHAIARRADESV